MKTIITTKIEYIPKKDEYVIVTTNIESEIKYVSSNNPDGAIMVVSDSMADLYTAARHYIEIETSLGVFNFKSMSEYNKNLIFLKHTSDEHDAAILIGKIATYFSKNINLMSFDDMVDSIRKNVMLSTICNTDTLEYIKSLLSSEINKYRKSIEDMLKVPQEIIGGSYVVEEYNDEFARKVINQRQKIFCLNDVPGCGKTTNGSLNIYKKAKEVGMHPIILTGKNSLAKSISCGDDYYLTVANASDSKRDSLEGVIGVSNTLLSGKLDALLGKCSLLIIEEIDDLFTHFHSTAAGKTLQDRAKSLEKFFELCKSVDLIVVSDAVCGNSIKTLSEETGFKVDVYTQSKPSRSAKKFIVHKSEAGVVSVVDRALEAGNTALVLADCSHNENYSHFNVLNEHFSNNVKTAKFDAAAIKSLGDTNLNDAITDSQCAIISPAINVGVSIYAIRDIISMICHGVQHPIQLIQFSQRYRPSCDINVSFKNNKPSHVSFNTVLSLELERENQESMITDAMISSYAKNKYVRILIERIIFENVLRSNFATNTLIIANMLGYEIEFATQDVAASKRTKKEMKLAADTALTKKINGASVAKKITEKQALVMSNNSNTLSDSEKNELYAYKIRAFYGEKQFNEGIMRFDNSGQGMKIISNLKFARGEHKENTAADSIKKKIINKLLSILSVDNAEFRNIITIEQINSAYEFLLNGVVVSNNRNIKVSSRLPSYAPSFKILKQKTTMINYVLSDMFDVKISTIQKRDSNRNFLREFVKTDRHEQAQLLYTEIK
jgi:uncharacterized protein YlzI (FlbEa/FlbD family)